MTSHILNSSDTGRDCVYVIRDHDSFSYFGQHGRGDLEFRGANSLVVDDAGNMIVSDGLNYKLKVVSRDNEYLGLVQVTSDLR